MKGEKDFLYIIPSFKTFLEYEVRGRRYTGRISSRFLQDIIARYIWKKTRKKYEKYLTSIAIQAKKEREEVIKRTKFLDAIRS